MNEDSSFLFSGLLHCTIKKRLAAHFHQLSLLFIEVVFKMGERREYSMNFSFWESWRIWTTKNKKCNQLQNHLPPSHHFVCYESLLRPIVQGRILINENVFLLCKTQLTIYLMNCTWSLAWGYTKLSTMLSHWR